MLIPLALLISMLRLRLQALREDDRGMTTETIIITGVLATAALAVVGAIVAAITNKGSEIEGEIDGALALMR